MTSPVVEGLSHAKKMCRFYKSILKLHKGLPNEMKEIGNIYVKAEFRRHKSANQQQIDIFKKEWTRYYWTLAAQLSPKGLTKGEVGENLTEEIINEMSDQQLMQLYELKIETDKPSEKDRE